MWHTQQIAEKWQAKYDAAVLEGTSAALVKWDSDAKQQVLKFVRASRIYYCSTVIVCIRSIGWSWGEGGNVEWIWCSALRAD